MTDTPRVDNLPGGGLDRSEWRAEAQADSSKLGEEVFNRRAKDIQEMARLREVYLKDLLKYKPTDSSEKLEALRSLSGEEITSWLEDPKILAEMEKTYEQSIAEIHRKIVESARQIQEFADDPALFEKRFGFSVTKDQLAALKSKASQFGLVENKPLDTLAARTAKPALPVSPAAPPPPVK